ncbi:type III-B CRISPR module-associated Cmr3 family protein [Tepidimonas charontis]|uniref:CRISPR type III-B/RAMP module-associated protein Cmr3 n=1 Tax=Tepidimonas charontis TaxID=2267262 RepID=A0A554X3I0_9BURK|nr:type III-B CRISPR module-associated Cmr3 family protein [Tepidimonas charontis]TSE30400.1 CRISPR type III-B/RAMP module-associated protein Cmr3 [Tepidimonas charontis]
MTAWRFVQPVDTLSLRGNKLFGAAGDYGESGFPPKPSVLAGALRSLLLAQAADEMESFAAGQRLQDEALDRILGIPAEPGAFALRGVLPATRGSDGKVSVLLPLPADLLAFDEGQTVRMLKPQPLPEGVLASTPEDLSRVAILRQPEAAKPEGGWLINEAGIAAYLTGQPIQPQHLVRQSGLWGREARVGIALSRTTRTAEDGKLFTVEHTVPRQPEHGGLAVGLAVAVEGVEDRLPSNGFVRLGGDGRSAALFAMPAPTWPSPLDTIRQTGRFKLVLTTPGLFAAGWRPTLPEGLTAKLVCAAVPRFEVVSGWDLAAWTPKDAARAVPTGAVYWFEGFKGDPGKLAEWVAGGLWGENPDRQRRAEGFNNAWLAAWPQP